MLEQAFKNINNALRNELGWITEVGCAERTLRPGFRTYFDGLKQDEADQARPLLKQLDQIGDEPDYEIARCLFAAAASGLTLPDHATMAPPCHFALLTKVEPGPFLVELARMANYEWGRSSRHRTTLVQRETRSISLSVRDGNKVSHRHDQYVRLNNEYAERFPYLVSWLQEFATSAGNGSLQIARIVKLKPQGQVYRHVDRGLYYLIRDRYHLVLHSPSGSRMQCAGQSSTWRPGELWWFNNHVPHQAFNDSEDERIHVIFDVLPHRNQVLVPYFQWHATNEAR